MLALSDDVLFLQPNGDHTLSTRPTFSILHTSARPDAWRAVYDAWIKAAARPEDVEYVLVVDPRWGFGRVMCGEGRQDRYNGYYMRTMRGNDKAVVNTGRMCYVDGVNIASEHATGNVLIVVADDQFPCDKWDEVFGDSCDRVTGGHRAEFVVRVPTGTPQEIERNITVMPIVSRARYQRLGYIFYPGYESMFADNDLSEHAQHDGCFIEASGLPEFPHRHDWFNQGGGYHEWVQVADSAYQRQNRPEAYATGARVLAERRASGFGSKLAAVPNPTVPNTGKNIAVCIPGEWYHASWIAENALALMCHLLARFRNVWPVMPQMSNVHMARHACFEYIKSCPQKVDYVLWIDDDNLVSPQAFETLLNDLECLPDLAGVVGWCWIHPDARISCGPFNERGTCESFDYEKMMADPADLIPLYPQPGDKGGWSGFPLVLHRGSVIEDIGPFPFRAILNDEWRTGMTGEDVAFFMNANEAGLKFALDKRVKIPHLKFGNPEPDWMLKGEGRKTTAMSEMVAESKCTTFKSPGPPWYGAQCRRAGGHTGVCDFGTQEEAEIAFYKDSPLAPKRILDRVRKVVGL